MRLLLRRALQGAGAAGMVIALSSAPVSAGVGTRLANGDGNTSGTCMSIVNAGRGTSVEMEPCTTNAHQGWELVREPHLGGVQILSQDIDAGGRCLTAHGQGVRVTMDRCVSRSTHPGLYAQQVWGPVTISGSWQQLLNYAFVPAGLQCLDVRDNGTSNVVQTWLCGPITGPNIKGNQLWKLW